MLDLLLDRCLHKSTRILAQSSANELEHRLLSCSVGREVLQLVFFGALCCWDVGEGQRASRGRERERGDEPCFSISFPTTFAILPGKLSSNFLNSLSTSALPSSFFPFFPALEVEEGAATPVAHALAIGSLVPAVVEGEVGVGEGEVEPLFLAFIDRIAALTAEPESLISGLLSACAEAAARA